MNLYSLDSVLLVLLVLGLIVPTGAAMHGDLVFGDRGIVLAPHDGPNGAYAEVGTEGNLSIDLATVGVNANAFTSIRNVFDVANHGQEPLYVWFTHGATDTVRFTVEEHGSIEGNESRVQVGVGEARPVSIWIDTTDRPASPEPLIRSFQIHVAPVGEEPATPTETPTATPTETPRDRSDEETETPAPIESDEDVEVTFFDATDVPVSVREVGVEDIERAGGEDDTRGPRAVIDHTHGDRAVFEAACPCADDPRLRAVGAQALVEVDEEITLSAARSLVGSMRSVDPERRIVRAVDIQVPEGREDSPATVRMRVDEGRFEATGLARPRIARKTDDGWQMLPTKVVGRDGGELILEARTPGFSVFAVFATNGVEYVWRVDGEEIAADELRHEWQTPGLHNVSLTVRDAFGRTDTATYTVLVNDPPSVAIDVVASPVEGRTTTLRANVENEVGNVTVSWLFPDGTRKTGVEVEHAFDPGEGTVRVEVEDEFGATGSAERSITASPVGRSEPLVDRIAGELPTGARLGVVALLSVVLALLLRRLSGGGAAWGAEGLVALLASALRNRPPQVVSVDSPTVDARSRRFEIGHLRVDDPDGNLEAVEIRVLDARGTEVAHKSIEVPGRGGYVSRNETVLPKSRVYVRDDEAYTVEVGARDAADRWSRQRRTHVRTSGAAEGRGRPAGR